MKNGKQGHVVVMDVVNAFDKVFQNKLLHKLHMYGIDPETREWCRFFLYGRTQHVVVDREASQEVEISSSIPQCLGPIVFLV